MPIIPEGQAPRAAIAVTAALAVGVGAHELADSSITTVQEAQDHNARVEACTGQLGEQATRTAHLPDACKPFEADFQFNKKWVRVRVPTHVDSDMPAFVSWRKKVFHLPAAYTFETTEHEPVPVERLGTTENGQYVLSGVIGLCMGIAVSGGMSDIVRTRRRKEAEAAEAASAPEA